MIIIVDYGESFISSPNYLANANTIQSILENLNIFSTIIRWNEHFPSFINKCALLGVILTGGPSHVYMKDSPCLPDWLSTTDVPVLGICYGMQLIAHYFKGKVIPSINGEFTPTNIYLKKEDPILGKIKSKIVWMNHHDIVSEVPENFHITSISENGYISSINDGKRWFGLQFHPEISVDNDNYGKNIFQNFLDICIAKTISC